MNEVDQYIAAFPKETAALLQELRKIITKAAPKAEETISYKMPAYKYHGAVVYFAGYKNHIGFYPTGSGIKAFTKEIDGYKNSKGAVQFPLDQPLPVKLITRMVQFKVKENLQKVKMKKRK
ncbi:iron chaperone [Ferruginibacter albus]|uniref:iron chaperone n=1 Tax=Ferruginibacter albus TaxID=2875540 RepID=UPI001CC396DA|nr:DUF1801 domain-containing protein [Ferruginibacter albus]UAY50830.1 DUF1801 domain-containing protein [Ferruginibacter albus]